MCNRLKMVRIDANPIAAKVVKFKSFWDRTFYALIIDTVGAPIMPVNFD